ncbi:hypothetical protein PR202_ga28622 [Eleusine coracana subsp. coracana]|uniref:Uncharacterized protein n=1 Tax=Eleusine coracana subsp. coracana TaxID=191504 RepID=A0AAV5DJQ7_ELECO|nr:hypothetical protein PR202_ga28622 [Eleusine coracana subsp. coracana]
MGFNSQESSAPLHTICKRKVLQAADQKNNKDPLATDKRGDPWNPPHDPCPPCKTWEEGNEWFRKTATFVAYSRATNIITPDRTPQWVSDALWHEVPELVSILEKDNVRLFLQFFSNNKRCMAWGFVITPETFNYIISENALRCAKVVLEGKAPELRGHRANPNYMNPYGYFPLHEAAERFSVDMINLLFKYGASANKIFLDTTRLLAKKTNNLLDELWNYVKNGKIVQTAVLLLAGQEQIRWGTSSKKREGFSKTDGFETIMTRTMKYTVAFKENRNEQNVLETGLALECITFLFNIISNAGEDLDAYIQTHSEVPNVEVLQRVSSILNDHGFFTNGEGINVGNLSPFDCKMFTKPRKQGHLDTTKVDTEIASPHSSAKKGSASAMWWVVTGQGLAVHQ